MGVGAGQLHPRITGWAGHAAPFAFELGEQRYAPGIRGWLHGSPGVASFEQATAGYETILEVGVDNIRAWSVHLLEALREDLLARGFRLHGPSTASERGGTLTVALADSENGPAFVKALESRGILVDHRPDAGLRVSPHFYTRETELREFAAVMSELRAKGSWKQHLSGRAAY
jgi:kynureninase